MRIINSKSAPLINLFSKYPTPTIIIIVQHIKTNYQIYHHWPSSQQLLLPLKTMLKTHFQVRDYFWQLKTYFTLKALFSRYLSFCLDILVIHKNGLRKIRLIFWIYDVTAWLENNCKNHTQNMMEKLFPEPFLKNRNCVRINILKLFAVNVTCMLIWELLKYSKIRLQSTCF